MRHQSKTRNICTKISLFSPLSNSVFERISHSLRLMFFSFGSFDTEHLFLRKYCSLHYCNKCCYLSFNYFCNFHSCQNLNMINSASDTSILRNLLANHTLQLSITVHHVCGDNFVASDCSQILLRNILFHTRNINFLCHVISNYFVGNSPFSINFLSDCYD